MRGSMLGEWGEGKARIDERLSPIHGTR